MFYYRIEEDGAVLGYAESQTAINFPTYFAIDEEEYKTITGRLQEQETIAELNERRAFLLEQKKTETDELNILLIERELKEINEYFESKE